MLTLDLYPTLLNIGFIFEVDSDRLVNSPSLQPENCNHEFTTDEGRRQPNMPALVT